MAKTEKAIEVIKENKDKLDELKKDKPAKKAKEVEPIDEPVNEGYASQDSYSDDDLCNGMNTLIRASEILQNRALINLIQQYAKKESGRISSVQDLRALAKTLNPEV